MKADDAIEALAERFGILPSFRDLSGKDIATSRDTSIALLRANGLHLDNDAMVLEELAELQAADNQRPLPRELIVPRGNTTSIDVTDGLEWALCLEGQQNAVAEGRSTGVVNLPAMPSGIHTLSVGQSGARENVSIFAVPNAAPALVEVTGQSKLWGVTAALYGLHSVRSTGLGDFEDLARAAEIFGGCGADFFGINPVHNLGWADTETISPYSPSHRGFLNTSYIAPDKIFGLDNSPATNSCETNTQPAMIDYAGHRETHQRLLRSLFQGFLDEAGSDAKDAFSTFRKQRGQDLAQFAHFEVLSENNGPDWRKWPTPLHSPTTGTIETAEHLFHCWSQWQADIQLADAQRRAKGSGMSLGLYLDLAVGSRRGGAESWCEKDSIADGVSIGAPPDHLSPAGQNWNLSAFSPRKLADNQFRAFRQVLRQNLRHCGVLRIDHILGLNRSFWIPDDGSPGGYIKQPFESYLAVLAIEAERAGSIIIGEDLGLIPAGFREAINKQNIYSYRVLQYELHDTDWLKPAKTAAPYLACFGTHDTPTLRGFWQGHDIDWWKKLGWQNEQQSSAAQAKRKQEVTTLTSLNTSGKAVKDGSFEALRDTVHSALGNSPAALVSVTLDDITGEKEAQNIPGTIDEHPNWRRRCPLSIEEVARGQELAEVGKLMSKMGRSRTIVD